MKLNLGTISSEIQEVKYEPLPEGKYKMQIVESEITKSKRGVDMVVLEFKFCEDPTNFKGRKIKEYFVADSEYAMIRLKQVILKCNILNGQEEIDLEEVIAQGWLIGVTMDCYVVQKPYTNANGVEVISNKIKTVMG